MILSWDFFDAKDGWRLGGGVVVYSIFTLFPGGWVEHLENENFIVLLFFLVYSRVMCRVV